MEQNNHHRMVSLIGKYLHKLVIVQTDCGVRYIGVLKEVKPEVVDNYIVLSTWDSSSQKVDGSKIFSFYCDEDSHDPAVRELIGKHYEKQVK